MKEDLFNFRFGKQHILISSYLLAIITANLLVAYFGPSVAIINAFLFIGLDLTTRDFLHEIWEGKHLWGKMLLLIAAGSVVSWALNRNSASIALASFLAFFLAGIGDVITYSILGDKSRLLKINGSNVVSSGIDSLIFPIVAFGFPVLWGIVLGQFIAKIGGGFIWALIISKLKI